MFKIFAGTRLFAVIYVPGILSFHLRWHCNIKNDVSNVFTEENLKKLVIYGISKIRLRVVCYLLFYRSHSVVAIMIDFQVRV